MELTTKRNIGDSIYTLYKDKIRCLFIIEVTLKAYKLFDNIETSEVYTLSEDNKMFHNVNRSSECFDSEEELINNLRKLS